MPLAEPVILIVTTQTWRQLTRIALRLSRYGCKVSALCPAQSELRLLERLHTCHVFNSGNPLLSLEAAIAASGAAYLVPGDDLAVWLLHELSERSPEHRKLVERSLGPACSFRTVRSRSGLLALAASLGIAVPETAVVSTLEEAQDWSAGRRTSFLLKKDGTFGGGGVEIVEDVARIGEHYARLHAQPTRVERLKRIVAPLTNVFAKSSSWNASWKASWNASRMSEAEVSAQTYIEGVAANAMFACDKGRILGSVQVRVIAARGKTGPAVMVELLDDARLARAGMLLANSLGLSGFFGLDFILEENTGIPYLIEMNPRCTQLGHVAWAGHAELAALLWAEWSGHTPPPVGSCELADSICFYPQASAGVSDNGFLRRARPDVCAEDIETLDRLAQGSPAFLARSYRAARRPLVKLKHSLAPPAPPRIHYFGDQLPVQRRLAGGNAALGIRSRLATLHER